jgi:hypothetical protein
MRRHGLVGAGWQHLFHATNVKPGGIIGDSEGRIRTERAMAPGGKQGIVEISDPVLGASWVLDTRRIRSRT